MARLGVARTSGSDAVWIPAPRDAYGWEMATAIAPLLSDDQLAELLELVADADSVELKATVPETEHFAVARALGLDPLGAQIRQVFFFDTPDLALNQRGLVVRARRIQGKRGDAIVKMRPVVPGELPKGLRTSPYFNVEVDAMPGGFVCSGTMKQRVPNERVAEVAAGKRPLGSLLAKDQRRLLPKGEDALALDRLSILGPILVLKLKWEPEGYPRPLVVELWLYPDGSRILELSTKCAPADAFLAATETRVFLSKHGIELSGEQETKTARALEFFAEQL
jgi:hypothetical protein